MSNTLQDRLVALKVGFKELEEKLTGLQEDISATQEVFDDAKKYINDTLPTSKQASDDIRAYKETSQSTTQEIQTLLGQIKESLIAVAEGENNILGERQTDGTRQGGLRASLTEALEGMQNQTETQAEEYEELRGKIEGLLPGATSLGLAQAYKIQKDTYWWGGIIWPTIFILAIALIVLVGFFSFKEVTAAITIEEATVKLLARLPFYLAAIWLASFASKRQSQNKRLQQEYAHKEAVSRSLEGYKREIAQSTDAMPKLLTAVVEMLGSNPSETLDKHHGDDRSPVVAFFEYLTSSRVKKE